MSNLLDRVLSLPEFKHYKQLSDDDWRDPGRENANFSISSKGWFNHTDEKSGSLASLLPQLNVKKIYDESTSNPFKVKKYFKTRGISVTVEIIEQIGSKINTYIKEGVTTISIVTPLYSLKGAIVQLHKVIIDNKCHKVGKSQLLGKNLDYVDRCITIKRPGKKYVTIEGLEDGLVVKDLYSNHNILISGGAKQTKRLLGFLRRSKETIAILDNDISDTSLKYSFCLGSQVKRLMPVEQIDANEALQKGNLDSWFATLQEKSYIDAQNLNKDAFTEQNVVIEELNNKHAVISIQGKVVIMNKDYDPAFKRQVITFSNQTDFALKYQNRFVTLLNEKGDFKKVPITKLWLNSPKRLDYDGLCFDPDDETDEEKFYNVWQGFAYEPEKGGNCSLYYEHIYNNICKKDEALNKYVLNWMADGIQNPKNKEGICIILRSGQGTGKGVFINHYKALFGQHGLYITNIKHLTGSFNAHMKECLLLFADEMFISGDKGHDNQLKTLISETETMIEYKGKDAFAFPNYTKIMMSSNEHYVVKLDSDNRRILIIDVGYDNCKDYPFFREMKNQMEKQGGYQQLIYDLMNRPIISDNIKNFPTTAATTETKLGSLNTVQQWLYNLLIDGELPPQAKIDTLYQNYKNTSGDRPMSKHQWSHYLKLYVPGMIRKQVFGETKRYYAFPSIEQCQKSFSKFIGVDLEKTFK